MKFNPKALPITSKALFTIVGGVVLINPVYAQEQSSEELEEVVVTGLRGSLKASMETKRDALGVSRTQTSLKRFSASRASRSTVATAKARS
jgi:hypothetical protein